MTDPAVHASRNAGPPWLAYGWMLGPPALVAVFLTLTEAFGLQILPVGWRFLYWLALLETGQIGSLAIRASLDRVQASGPKLVLAGAVRCIVVSLPTTVVVWAVTSLVLSQPLRAARLPAYYVCVLVVVAAMMCINLLTQRRPVETHAKDITGASLPNAPPASILARFPPKLRGAKLYAVQAEDHYIRIHTSAGSDLVLLRFSDALNELRGIEGAQVHRSWWVARDAVEGSGRDSGKLYLQLRGGEKAPVSRTFTRALQAEGWL